MSSRAGHGVPVASESPRNCGVTAQPDAVFGDRPFFLTMTETVGPAATRHVDVSLWFALAGRLGQSLSPEQREFAQVRWWTSAELRHAVLDRFEPHLLRALDALGLGR